MNTKRFRITVVSIPVALFLAFMAWIIWTLTSGAGAHSWPSRSQPKLPGLSAQPLTRWTGDGATNHQMRLVRMSGSCYIENVSGDNGLDVQLVAARCPQ